MAGRKTGMSWGEISDYEGCVDQIRKISLDIAKETRDYIREGMLVIDGDAFTSNIKSDIAKIQAYMRKINAYSKKYRDL